MSGMHVLGRIFLSMFLSTGFAFVCPGQSWDVFDMGNSPLPSTTVNALVEDGEGGLWIGTDWGLCHFDGGTEWLVYQTGNSALLTNDVRALARDSNDRIWIGTVDEGLFVLDGDAWSVYTSQNSPLPENGIRDVFVDHRDWVWATTTGGLACFTGSEWRVYDESPESHGGLILNTANTRCVAVRLDGLVCLGTFNGGLHFITETSVFFLNSVNNGFFDNTASDVLFDPVSGDRWVCTPSAGLLRQQGPPQGGSWFQWNGSIGFPSNGMTCAAIDGQGRVWSGAQIFGLIRVDTDGTFTQFTEANSGLPDDEIRSVLVAEDGAIWVGTVYGGLARYRETVGFEDVAHASFQVFPNPTSSSLAIEVDGSAGGWEWTLWDVQQRKVDEGASDGGRVQLSVLGHDPGVYMLVVRSGGFVATKRILVV